MGKKGKNRYGHVSKEEINQIHLKTGIPRKVVKKCLSVFSRGFKAYLKGPLDLPLNIYTIFTIYKKKYKMGDLWQDWRKSDNDLPYKK